MADGWYQKSEAFYEVHEPVLLIITFFETTFNNVTKLDETVSFTSTARSRPEATLVYLFFFFKKKISVYYYMSDFDENVMDSSKFRITDCYGKEAKKHFRFSLPSLYSRKS